jgi:hypothetical protein
MRTIEWTIVHHDATGFAVDETNRRTVPRRAQGEWRDVTNAMAWKRDLIVTDRVCLALWLRDGHCVELHEEMAGWPSLLERLPAYLPCCRAVTAWWPEVVVPAFAANPTVIYDREPAHRR